MWCRRPLMPMMLGTCLWFAALASAAPQSAPKFAYFLDDFTDANIGVATPPGTVLIGWSRLDQREKLTDSGRVTGCSAGLSSTQTSHLLWADSGVSPNLQTIFNSGTPDLSTPVARQTFAALVLAAGVSANSLGASLPSADEAIPNAAGGYSLWAQDFEGTSEGLAQKAAAIIALNWAGRELMGSQMQIIPIAANALQLPTATQWDLNTVLTGTSSDKFVSILNLQSTLSATNLASLENNEIDLFSLMHLVTAEGHPLIDGVMLEQFKARCQSTATGCPPVDVNPFCCRGWAAVSVNCAELPGSWPIGVDQFFDTSLPYAMLSAHDNPAQLFLCPPAGGCPGIPDPSAPWESYYRVDSSAPGAMPFQAGVYWSGQLDPLFNPTQYLTPTLSPSVGGEDCPADLTGDSSVDGADLAGLLGAWGAVADTSPADLDSDADVDGADMAILLSAWGDCPVAGPAPMSWLKVLVADDEPPTAMADLQTYVAKIHALAPSLEQIHLRVKGVQGGTPNYQAFADLISGLRSAYYPNPILIGFHPDNSTSSCASWNCSGTPCDSTNPLAWQCVLNNSIAAMNAINAIADPQAMGAGFNIFSIEQSYVEDVSNVSPDFWLSKIKATLAGVASIDGVQPASPPVKCGTVGPSYGGPEIYGATGFDYGYPQMYNLGKHLPAKFSDLVTGSMPYFPDYSAESCLDPQWEYPFMVVDVDSSGAYLGAKIPCFGPLNAPNVYTFSSAANPGPNPTLTAAYVAFLMSQYPPVSNTVPLGGSEVFMMFSGEPQFLGSAGWTLEDIDQFYQELYANFTYLKSVPGLIPAGQTDPLTMQYGIWNFSSILDNITLP